MKKIMFSHNQKTSYGDKLNPSARAEALRRFVHRMTKENIAARSAYAKKHFACGYRMPILTDAEWLACTEFAINKDGSLNRCVSSCWCHQKLPVKKFTVSISHTSYSSGEITVEADTEEAAQELAEEKWNNGEIETNPVDGEFSITGTEEIK